MNDQQFYEQVRAYAAAMPRMGADENGYCCYTGETPCLIGHFMAPAEALRAGLSPIRCLIGEGQKPKALEGVNNSLLIRVQEAHDSFTPNDFSSSQLVHRLDKIAADFNLSVVG